MTSSGFADGLGRRTLAFDREEGVMLERLVLRPELGAFESMLRDRLDSLGTLEDERIARPRTIERDVDGSLVVVSEFVPGSRLAESPRHGRRDRHGAGNGRRPRIPARPAPGTVRPSRRRALRARQHLAVAHRADAGRPDRAPRRDLRRRPAASSLQPAQAVDRVRRRHVAPPAGAAPPRRDRSRAGRTCRRHADTRASADRRRVSGQARGCRP